MSDWRRHDGGPCPVRTDAWVELPAGTYHSDNGRGTLGPFTAGDLVWRKNKIFHMRDEIQSYRVMTDEEARQALDHIMKKRTRRT